MRLHVIGSSSAGNGYVLDNGTEALVIECGVPLSDVKKALGFNISMIMGAIISHIHNDHSGFAKQYSDARIRILALQDVINGKKLGKTAQALDMMQTYHFGGFKVLPFPVQHDVPCAGYLIHHQECGNVLFATDTYYLKYKFTNLNNIMIECNYRDDILTKNILTGKIPDVLLKRTIHSHMSYDTCLSTLKANDLKVVNNIVLIHLSDGNSNALEFQKGIHEATGKNVIVAESGMTINFNKTPF